MVQIGKWELRGRKRGVDKRKCPLCGEGKNVVRMLLKYIETQKQKLQFLNNKCLYIK